MCITKGIDKFSGQRAINQNIVFCESLLGLAKNFSGFLINISYAQVYLIYFHLLSFNRLL